MVQAVVFDCFGVLATEGWLAFKAKYFGHDRELYDQVSDISHQADRGLISHEAAITATAELARVSPNELRQAIGHNVPNEELFSYINELKTNYKLGLLSNAAENYLVRIFTDEQLEVFDAICLSFESGFIKPQPEAFETVARRLSTPVNTCVFVDDQEHNVSGARAVGMSAVLYRNNVQLKEDLGNLLRPGASD